MNTNETSLGTREQQGNSTGPRLDGVPVVQASALLRGSRELVIVHNGERYRLRVTQNGKLILTK